MQTTSKQDKKLRIMFNSNALWATSGYSTQMGEIVPLIQKEGYPIANINFYGQDGGKLFIDGVWHYPKIADQWGGDALIAHGADFKADVTITLQDIWVLNPEHMKGARRLICWVPVDHEPIPPAILERLRLCYRVIAPSPFAHRELMRVGIHSTYIPWTVDTDIFKKLPDKYEIKKSIGIPQDYFTFGMVAANKDNPPRKSFQEAMDAFKMFHDKHPKSALYIHTLIDQPGGFPIREYAKFLGINEFIYFPPAYAILFNVKRPDLARAYNMMDVYLAPSRNEGFGVPIIEAQSCEIPTIVTDFTAMRDLVEDGVNGYKVKVASKSFTPLLSYVAVPDTQSLYEKMELSFSANREKMGKAARKFVIENFDTKTIFKYNWSPFLKLLEQEVYPS